MAHQAAVASAPWPGFSWSGRRPGKHERLLAPALPREFPPGLTGFALHRIDLLTAALAGYLGVTRIGTASGLSDVWILQAVLLVRLALLGPTSWRSRDLWTALAAPLAAFVVGGLAGGESPARLAWMTVANTAGTMVGGALFQRDRGRSWLARDFDEVIWLWGACVLSVVVTLVLGGYPNVYPGSGIDLGLVVWCLLRQFAVLATAANCALPLYFRPSVELLSPMPRRWWPVYVVAGLACMGAPYVWPDLSLSWLVVVPAIAAGALMTLRPATLSVLVVACVSMFMPYPSYHVDPLFGLLRPEAAIDILFVFVSGMAVLILVFRQHGAALVTAYRGYAQGVSAHRELRDGVLQSMADGLLLTDRSGRVLLSNGAFAQLMGEAAPDLISLEWARQVHMQTEKVDRVLSAVEFDRFLRPRAGGMYRSGLVIPAGPAGARRFVVTTQDVLSGEEPLTLWLFRDVTAGHARERELELFAGTVASDLKAPLASLKTWMEAADDDLAGDDAEAGRYALDQAQAAIGRMRALIDDYLAEAVGRGGVLTRSDVALADVVGEICAVYRAQKAGITFDVDVPHLLHVDPALTRQLLANVIGHGVRDCPGGHAPCVRVHSIEVGPGWAEVQVVHRGRRLQLAARRSAAAADGGSAAVADGSLGEAPTPLPTLGVCTAIVARHGGSFIVEDNDWGGSTFRFTLPLAVAQEMAS